MPHNRARRQSAYFGSAGAYDSEPPVVALKAARAVLGSLPALGASTKLQGLPSVRLADVSAEHGRW